MTAGITKALRRIIMERDGYTCVLCTLAASDVHHLLRRSAGGRDEPRNLVCLCRGHHMRMHGELLWYDEKRHHDDMYQTLLEYLADYYGEEFYE